MIIQGILGSIFLCREMWLNGMSLKLRSLLKNRAWMDLEVFSENYDDSF